MALAEPAAVLGGAPATALGAAVPALADQTGTGG